MQLYVEADARARPETDIGAVGSARAWAEPTFRLYWMSHGLMLLATQTNLLATQWLVLDQTASRTMLGVVPLIQGVVVAAFSALGGIAADRLSRRDLLAAGRLVAVPVELGLAALAWFRVIHYWHAFIGQFAAGVLADHIDVTATMIAAGAFRLILRLVLLWVAIPVRRFALQPAV